MALAIATATVVSAQGNDKENMIVVPAVQTDKDSGNNGNTATNCGIKFNIRLSGVTKVELESVDGNPLAGTARGETSTEGTGFPPTATTLWLIISVCIRPWSREHS